MKTFLIRVLVVLAFLIAAILIINKAPQYELVYKYKDGDLRVIYNNQELTRDIKKLPEAAVYYNGEVLLSQDTIDILFDKDLYYEEKYSTLITTSNEHRADIEVGSSYIVIDGEKKAVSVPAIKDKYDYSKDDRYTVSKESKEVIFVPIKAVEEVYDIEATIYCLRNSHKGIIIGKNGEMLKRIGTMARKDMEQNFGTKVNLKTWVKVKEDWVNDEKIFKT